MNSRNLCFNLLIVFIFTAKWNTPKEVSADVTDQVTAKTDSFKCSTTELTNGTKIKSSNSTKHILKSMKNNLYRCDSDEYKKFLCQILTVYASNGKHISDNVSEVQVLLESQLLQKVEELLRVEHLGVLPNCLNTSEPKNITKLNSANATEIALKSIKSQEEIKKTNRSKLSKVDQESLDILLNLTSKEVDKKTSENNFSEKKDSMISRFPKKLKDMINDKSLPQKYIDLFGRNLSEENLKEVLMNNDEFLKLFLPPVIVEIMERRGLPIWLRKIALTNLSSGDIEDLILHNKSLFSDLFGSHNAHFFEFMSSSPKATAYKLLIVLIQTSLIIVLLFTGLSIEQKKILKHVRRPKGVLIGIISQFVLIPANCILLIKILHPDPSAAVSLLFCSCVSSGSISNLLTYILQGDINLSILMTVSFLILSTGLTPLSIYTWAKLIDSGIKPVISYSIVLLEIILVVFPLVTGCFIRKYFSAYVKITRQISVFILMVIMISNIGIVSWLFQDSMFYILPMNSIVACMFLPLSGFAFGYTLPMILGENSKSCRAIMLQTGCQNFQLTKSIVTLSFYPLSIGFYLLIPIFYQVFQMIEATVLIIAWKLYVNIFKDEDIHSEILQPNLTSNNVHNPQTVFELVEQTSKNESSKNEVLE